MRMNTHLDVIFAFLPHQSYVFIEAEARISSTPSIEIIQIRNSLTLCSVFCLFSLFPQF